MRKTINFGECTQKFLVEFLLKVLEIRIKRGKNNFWIKNIGLFPPGIEPGTFRVLGECDNRYTTETPMYAIGHL